jgi:long-chain acyl-CoA synthetase
LPLFHSGGQHTLLFALHVGRPAVLLERFDVATLGHLLERHRFDNLFLLPTMLYDVVHADPSPDLSSVRSVLVAGQALSIHLRRQFEERFRIPILMNYGSTETGHIAGWTSADMKAGLWKPGSAGRLYDGVELEIRDDDGTALPVGEAGEVCVRFSMTRGYVDDASATEELVRDGWVHSGDIGYVDQDGVLFLVGRKRDMIKCGGFQVWPEEIEEQLRTHPLVRDVRVLGVPHDRLGEIPRAVVVREPGDEPTDDALGDALVELARERLAHFKAPREVVFVEELPRSAAGKVQRHALDTGGSG